MKGEDWEKIAEKEYEGWDWLGALLFLPKASFNNLLSRLSLYKLLSFLPPIKHLSRKFKIILTKSI
jgi:hypothetical protein